MTTGLSALTELVSLTAGAPARVQMLQAMLRASLTAAAPRENRELFLAATLLLQARQRGPVPDAAWSRLWNAADALLEHYGIESAEDLVLLETAS